jgi:hypothetical protein
MLPYKGSNPKFNAGGPDWQPGISYATGALIQPTAHNSGNFVYMALPPGGTSATTGPNPWNQTVCARQADGTCSGGTQPDGGITWQNVGIVDQTKMLTGIFDPGLYYIAANGLSLGDNTTVRMSTATGDGSRGVTFYFSTSASVAVGSNSGKSPACTSASSGSDSPSGCVVAYQNDGTLSPVATGAVASVKLQCPTGSPTPLAVPTTIAGNILLGPCTGTYKSPDGNRGFLFFQNRATAATPSWGGGGSFLSSGFMYFHKGNGACGTGASCLTLQGGSGSQGFTLGNIVTDEVALGGNPQINMILNPAATFSVLRPSLLM